MAGAPAGAGVSLNSRTTDLRFVGGRCNGREGLMRSMWRLGTSGVNIDVTPYARQWGTSFGLIRIAGSGNVFRSEARAVI
jgi:hypothetical protein